MERLECSSSRVALVNASPFTVCGGKYYLDPAEFTSLSQWFPLFGSSVLFKPRRDDNTPPKGWLEVPGHIEVVETCRTAMSRSARMRSVAACIKQHLEKIDILYVRMPNYEGYESFRVAKQKNIPLLLELHGDWESAILEEDQHTLLRRLTRRLRARLAHRTIQEMVDYASLTVTIGPQLATKYSCPKNRTLIFTNHLLRQDEYGIVRNGDPQDPPRILYVGDIQRRKGLHLLFEALESLVADGFEFEMVMIGDGPLESELKETAIAGGFGDSVNFQGRVPHGPKLFEWFKKSDLFVLPSIAAEGVPRVTHEAMAFGCPVVATDIGSIPWQLSEGCGELIPHNSAPAIKSAIERVVTNAPHWRRLASNGFQRSLEYSLERQQQRLREFLSTKEIIE